MTANVPATVFGGKVDVTDMKSLAQKAKSAADNNPRGGGAPNGSEFMNFSGKKGIFSIGKDRRVIQNDEIWLVDVASFEEGWVCWKGGRPAANRMSNIYTGVPVAAPDPEELGPFNSAKGDGWYQAKGLVMKSFDTEEQGYFKINSVSGVGEMSDLMEKFSERASQDEPCWPLVCLDTEEFEAQGFKNSKPLFVVQAWATTEQITAYAAGDLDLDTMLGEEGEEEASPEPEPEPEPVVVAKPVGRRRARVANPPATK
jgi:hypothetical protein